MAPEGTITIINKYYTEVGSQGGITTRDTQISIVASVVA